MNILCAARACRKRKKDLVAKVEGIAVEMDELAKVIDDLEAQLKESESKLQWLRRRRPTRSLKRS